MTRDEFDTILASAGIMSAKARQRLWDTRPFDDLNEEVLRRAAKKTLREIPIIGFPDPKEVE